MKKSLAIALSILLVFSVLAGCGSKTNENNNKDAQNDVTEQSGGSAQTGKDGQYADGVYFAEAKQFDEKSGWKEIIALKVEDGHIVAVNWNALHKDGGLDKKASSEQGYYGMTKGGAQAEWHEQAAKAEQFLLDKQDPAAIPMKDDGKTDAISGVSVTVSGLVELAQEALAAGPVEAGPYKDGTYTAEEKAFDEKSGWKYNVTVTVMNGDIVAANWNGTHKDGGDDKKTQSADGRYGMVEKGGAQAEWHEQAKKVENYLIEIQDPAKVTWNDNGVVDAISGVSIHSNEFFTLVQEALKDAK